MKRCTWCGKEYSNENLTECLVDGQPLSGPERPVASKDNDLIACAAPRSVGRSPPEPAVPSAEPRFVDLRTIEGVFTFQEGYSRPDWALIRRTIEQTVAPDHISEAWSEAALQWVRQLRSDLGGDYRVDCSHEFVMLSAVDSKKAKEILDFAERTLERIYALLREAAWQWANGKHVILIFEEQDDYYQYVSYYHREGTHPATGGCLIHRDYVHIAMPYGNGRHLRGTLAHELLHNSVVHLPLPLWLNEGLATAFSRDTDNVPAWILDGDAQQRHLAFWNAATIQQFWAGTSFRVAGDSCELSYSLAEILFHLLSDKKQFLPAFVRAAQFEDAGQAAALDILGVDLGQLAGTFLGEGEWRPNRKAIAELHKPRTPD